MVIEINEKTNDSSIIYFDLDEVDGVLTGTLLSNKLESFCFESFNLAKCIAKICGKKMGIEMSVVQDQSPKEMTVSRKTETYYPLLKFEFLNAKDRPLEEGKESENLEDEKIKKEA